MSPKERFLCALERKIPDRLPVTTHHVMPYFLNKYMKGMNNDEFFDFFGIDPITWIVAHIPDPKKNDYLDPGQKGIGFLEVHRVVNDNWRIETAPVSGYDYPTTRYSFVTPKKTLTMTLQSNDQTAWVVEHIIKEKNDIDILAEYMPHPLCDVNAINKKADKYGDRGLVRGHIPCFDVFGQPGTWQDACCLAGTEDMIMSVFDDPEWVHTFLRILMARKIDFAGSLAGAKYDILELGGGSASTTVISPAIFEKFVQPYDSRIIAKAHEAGQRIAYHTCGGMMPILELIADMNPDAMETFTPHAMGGDTDLAEAKKRIGHRVCMIGGFDQFHYFTGTTPEETKKAVRRCFDEAGQGGGYILSPSDHFFDADLDLLKAFADEARECVYVP